MIMHHIALKPGADLDGFRRAVRSLIASGIEPSQITWSADDSATLFGATAIDPNAPPVALSRAASELIELVVCHNEPERFALAYRLIWRLLHGEPALFELHSDRLVHRLQLMAKSVRRDTHKMHAFLRFRRVDGEAGERFVGWFEPEHFILERAAPFFVERFRALDWTILTPVGSIRWDRHALSFGPPGKRGDAPDGDAFEPGWRGYYESTFNPARVNPKAMRAEMPKKYWRNMPETRAVPGLIRSAQARTQDMIAAGAGVPIKRDPAKAVAAMQDSAPKSLAALNRIIAEAGPLVPGATQAVLGEGPQHAALVFVGEQPGDQEDLQGRPFVGPAGQLLRSLMAEAGIDSDTVYLTNAVKHFKYVQRGKRRIHQKPAAGEVKHYQWWLEQELRLVAPQLVVALGATATLALTGKSISVTRYRGEAKLGPHRGFITVHPSYLLRLPESEAGDARAQFLAELMHIREIVQRPQATSVIAAA
jgi:DNA polymerase